MAVDWVGRNPVFPFARKRWLESLVRGSIEVEFRWFSGFNFMKNSLESLLMALSRAVMVGAQARQSNKVF